MRRSWSIRSVFMPASMLALLLAQAGCGGDPRAQDAQIAPRPVRLAALEAATPSVEQLSGVVRARYEIPLSFQVSGRIQSRQVDAGQRVQAGAILFLLDERDLAEQLRGADAAVRAAHAEAETAAADSERLRALVARGFVDAQAADRAAMIATTARENLAAATAVRDQARNSLRYARLAAPTAGTLIEVGGEPGQVVAIGQAVAVLAADGEREVEVSLPDALQREVARRSQAQLPGSAAPVALELRELAGAADPVSRTWRARYRFPAALNPALGTIVRVSIETGAAATALRSVPLTALDERGGGARVWTIVNGRAEPHPIEIRAIGEARARIATDLIPGTEVIALGTHLLQPGMPVRALQR